MACAGRRPWLGDGDVKAKAMSETSMLPSEPVTIVLSQMNVAPAPRTRH
ncbi:hypothetical protein MJ561_25195 [Klebsiella pneumoniae]|nr:hypothetical protein MJ561_25195 [Klebsiella pneumoniae]